MMLKTFRVTLFWLMLGIPAVAQTFAPASVPPTQFATADRAVSGNEFEAWLWPGVTDNRALTAGKLTRCRLAALDTVNASGAITSLLSAAATNALDHQVNARLLLIKPIGWEPYFTWDQSAQPQPRWQQSWRLVVLAWLIEWDKDERPSLTDDLAVEQLKRGLAYLNRTAKIELSHFEWPLYEAAQLEAQKKMRGLWFFGQQAWSPAPIERDGGKRQPMPTRTVIK